jgi:hypothetical protein
MAAKYIMQARSDADDSLVVWKTDEADFAGAQFPGPGSPLDVSIVFSPASAGGGGVSIGLVYAIMQGNFNP